MVKRSSLLPPLLEQQDAHPCHPNHKERGIIVRKTGSLLLWLLLVSIVFLLFITCSLIPTRPILMGDLSARLVYPPDPMTDTPREEDISPRISIHQDQRKEDACDLSMGKWVWNPRGPIYTNWSCSTLPDSKNCGKYGKAQDFVNWRWKPDECKLPRFDPEAFLRMVRGKRLAFVGDSVARNQMESLLCLLSQVETPIRMHKDAEERFLTWYFNAHDFTLMTLWTKFLIHGMERVINGSASGVFDLHVDIIDTNWTSRLPTMNYIVFSDGHWFFRKNYVYEGGKLMGCVFCSEANLTDLGVKFTIQRAFRTSLQYIHNRKEFEGVVLVRTFSPAHFENGAWNSGGYCNKTKPLNEGDVKLVGTPWELRAVQVEELRKMQGEERRKAQHFGLLDVTKAMLMRSDGHPGSHWNSEWMRGFNDCVHWCLPGAIDMWNDMLLAVLKKA